MDQVIVDTLKEKNLVDLVVVIEHPEKPKQVLTKEQVEDAIPLLKTLEAQGGYHNVSRATGLKVSVLKEIHAGMRARIAEIMAAEEPVVEEPKEPVIEEVIR